MFLHNNYEIFPYGFSFVKQIQFKVIFKESLDLQEVLLEFSLPTIRM